MPQTARRPRNAGVVHTDTDPRVRIIDGLLATPKRIDSRFFYDKHGSQLFEAITGLPEYYPTRTERALLEAHSAEIAVAMGRGQLLVEPGAGSCSKVRLLLPELAPACYVPVDISGDFLRAAARELQRDFPSLRVLPLVGDMGDVVSLPPEYDMLLRNVFYPGSTIGNYQPEQAETVLRGMHAAMNGGGHLLIGVDLQKDPSILHAAYNDSAGVTARFNLNILTHINRIANADFDIGCFRHVAFYNEAEGRIEMHVESTCNQRVTVGDMEIRVREGERILTEYSYKYTLDGFADLASRAGFVAAERWVDDKGLFSLQHFRSARGNGTDDV